MTMPIRELKPDGKPAIDPYWRVNYFPTAVSKLKRRLEALLTEARDTNAGDILKCLDAANAAWEREIEIARLQQQIRRERDK